MADAIRIGPGVPLVPLRRADDLKERIEALKNEAAARGFSTLAYFLETALIEAEFQEQHVIDDTAIARSKLDNRWQHATSRSWEFIRKRSFHHHDRFRL